MSESSETAVSELLRERLRLDAELQHYQQAITVLFVDIVGSTRFYEQHGDVAGLAMVQKFLDKLVPVIELHEGVVVKTIGDAILARFSTAINGVRCALAMQFSLLQHNLERAPVDQIHIRVALNSGFALIKGSDIFGDVVNVCSRIESAAKPNDILISPSVFDQICQYSVIAVRKRAEGVQLKGKTEKLDLYEVVWQMDEPVGPAPSRPSESQVAMAALPHAPDLADVAAQAQSPAPVAAPQGPALPSAAHQPQAEFAKLRGAWSRAAIFNVAGRLLLFSVVTVALVMVGGLFFSSRRVTALSEKDTIVVADFENRTGDPVFDETLKQALAVDLGQSPFLNIVSERKMMATLRLMSRAPEQPVLGEIARDLCQRVRSKALLSGSISKFGNNYVIGLNAIDCSTGDAFVKQQVEANGKEDVLKALGRASKEMRRRLGESLPSVQRFGTPIEEATTSSIEALKAYSEARRVSLARGDLASIPYYQRALDLDPNFATAYAGLAVAYNNLRQATRAADNSSKAYQLPERANERERYRISSLYYAFALGDLVKEQQVLQLWKQSYPRDVVPVSNLGANYEWLGQWEKALDASQQSFHLEPNSAVNLANLAWEQLALNRPEDAKATIEQGLARGVDSLSLQLALYHVAFVRGDEQGMQQQLARMTGRPGEEDWLLSAQSDTEAYFGRLANARELSRRAVELARRADANETAAIWQVNAALREAEFGNAAAARQQAAAALALMPGRDVRSVAALAFARAGDVAHAQNLADALNQECPQNTIVQGFWLPAIRAAVRISTKDGNRAVELLQGTAVYDMGQFPPFFVGTLYPAYVRGEAYLLARRGREAAAEFQRIIDHRGIVLNYPTGTLAYLGLARAYALQGDSERARSSYDRFLTLWKHADPDTPIFQQAKAEYAKLR